MLSWYVEIWAVDCLIGLCNLSVYMYDLKQSSLSNVPLDFSAPASFASLTCHHINILVIFGILFKLELAAHRSWNLDLYLVLCMHLVRSCVHPWHPRHSSFPWGLLPLLCVKPMICVKQTGGSSQAKSEPRLKTNSLRPILPISHISCVCKHWVQ